MPSDLIVEVCRIEEIKTHPNADKLELVLIKGWETAAPIGKYSVGDLVIYVPPDAVLPLELSEKWGVTNYLHKQRVKAIRLRGEMSFGLIAENEGYKEGADVKDKLKITKYEPPKRGKQRIDDSWKKSIRGIIKHYWKKFYYRLRYGYKMDFIRDHSQFHKYTHIQNIRNFPLTFDDGEEVICTEKAHGTNDRVGLVMKKRNRKKTLLCAGSHNVRRKMEDSDLYTYPLIAGGGIVEGMLTDLYEEKYASSVILFSEIYGCWTEGGGEIQKNFSYGHTGPTYRAFDISVDKRYLDYDEFKAICDKYKIPTMPIIYRGPYSKAKIEEITEGTSMINPDGYIREGTVIRPVIERAGRNHSRSVLKSISNEYLLKKDNTEYH